MRRAFFAVALLALACLLVRAARVGLAGDYIDPISRITAQDEALYSHSAIAMAREGDWLTPRFMGRYALYKPPLLIWGAALATRILGVSRLALRLPGVILSALALGLLFLWACRTLRLAGGCDRRAHVALESSLVFVSDPVHDRRVPGFLLRSRVLRNLLRSVAGIACRTVGLFRCGGGGHTYKGNRGHSAAWRARSLLDRRAP